jgi:cell division transport system ATP-binding protein
MQNSAADTAARPPVVTFDDVGLTYDDGPEILQNVSFSLPAGSFHFLTGPSGAGKTSLLKLLYLGQHPSRGRITLLGQDPAQLKRQQLPELRRQIGIVFQDFRLMPHLSAFDNVALPLRANGMPESDIQRNVTELMRWVDLGDRLDAKPATLSGGEQQRVAIARAVINRPKLLVADEPTGNIDPAIGTKILYLFEELNRHGTTVVIATHDDDIVRRFNHPELHLEKGSLRVLPARQKAA